MMASKATKPGEPKKAWAQKTVIEKTKTVLLTIVALFFLLLLIGIIFGDSGGKQTQNVDQNAPVDKQIEQIVRNSVDESDFQEARATEQVGGGYGVYVKIYDETTRKGSIGEKMADIYKALYTSGKDINTASIVATSTLANQYGDEAEVPVLKTTLDKAIAEKVNFDADEATLQYQILPGLWTVNSTHPVLRD